MGDQDSLVEMVYSNMRWGVQTVTLPAVVPGGPPVQKRILRFATQDQTQILAFPLELSSADEIGKELSKPIIATATEQDMAKLVGERPRTP